MDWKKILGELWSQELEDLITKGVENWVPQERVSEITQKKNSKIEALEKELETRDTQIGDLEKVAETSEELQKKLDEIKEENKKTKEEFDKYKTINSVKKLLGEKVHPKYVDLIFKEVNMEDVVVKGEEMIGLTPQLEQLEKKYTEVFKKKDGEGYGSGKDPNKHDEKVVNPWLKESFNLTEQGRLLRDDREKALRLRKEAIGK